MSSKRRVRRKSCVGKIAYAQESEAVAGMVHTQGTGLAVYKCRFCGAYHVGHMNRRQEQGRNARRAA